MRFEYWTSAEKTVFVILNFFKIMLFILKKKFYFYNVQFISRLFKSKTSPNFSILISKIFVKNENFELWRHYDVIMTSLAN